jgi:UPF0176 protein
VRHNPRLRDLFHLSNSLCGRNSRDLNQPDSPSQTLAEPPAEPLTHLAAYQFGALEEPRALREELQGLCKRLDLKGTILLSPEGINLFVSGEPGAVLGLREAIRRLPGFENFDGKFNPCSHQPYNRMLVRLKREIISFGVEGIDPARRTSPKLPPRELKRWLDEGRPVVLLDTRNDYEIKLGTFKGALTLDLNKFRDFPAAVSRLPESLKSAPIVMFCTGGIRCEKAGPYMERKGFAEIHQLEGGILKYFEECAGAHYEGECFVFDQRTGVDPSLHESSSTQCHRCQSPLTEEEQDDPRYQPGVSCPHCHVPPRERMSAALEERRAALRAAVEPLPGSRPYTNYRPVNVPADCDGMTLLPFLCRVLPHVGEQEWRRLHREGRLVDDKLQGIPADKILRAGMRCLVSEPGRVEPPVSGSIGLLHEDEALIVIDKPAPLPMHAGGRYHRNTLQHILGLAFHPLKPRPAHRLDANTTGVVLFAKTRHFASLLQPQFAVGTVRKTYLARCRGHPREDEFQCREPISPAVGPLGTRAIDADGLEAVTGFRVLARLDDGTALLEARPLTGRTNQIRLHLAHLGHPVCGDTAYTAGAGAGEKQTLDLNDPPLCLHALSIQVTHPLSGEVVTYHSPPPAWAENALPARQP